MIVNIMGKQLTVRESLKEHIEDKLAKFDKFFDDNTIANVTCKARKGVKIIELTVVYKDTIFRAEEESDTFITALDRTMESFERQIRKNKTRLENRYHASIPEEKVEEEDPYEEEAEFQIRVKSFALKPMGTEEAILQMNLLGHSFFVFEDAETGETCVVYKKKDGTYGLIVPER